MKGDLWIIMVCMSVLMACSSCTDAPEAKSQERLNLAVNQSPQPTDIPERLTQNQEDRSIWQRPDIVLSSLGNIEDKVIADLGAGTGYFTWRLIPHAKKIIALDIDDDAIQYLDSMSTFLPDGFKSQLEIRKTSPDRAELSPDEADIILIVNTYTYLPDRIKYLSALRAALPEDGQLLIIDFKKKIIPIGPESADRVALYQIEQELIKAGFHDVSSDDQSLNYQYIVKARK